MCILEAKGNRDPPKVAAADLRHPKNQIREGTPRHAGWGGGKTPLSPHPPETPFSGGRGKKGGFSLLLVYSDFSKYPPPF
jgi:hypothetical protein